MARGLVRVLDDQAQAIAGVFPRGGLLRLADVPLGLGDEGGFNAPGFAGRFRFVFGCVHKVWVQWELRSGLPSGRSIAEDFPPR
jgi:hypothetical protein